MSAIMAKVVELKGEAFVRAASGELHRLHQGDVVREGEQVVTSSGGSLDLALQDGRHVHVAEQHTLTIDAEVAAIDKPDAAAAAVFVGNTDVDNVLAALDRGDDISKLIEEPAAGLAAGGGDDGGSTFVRLLRVAEGVDPLSYAFHTEAPAPHPDALPTAEQTRIQANADHDQLTESSTATVRSGNLIANDVYEVSGSALVSQVNGTHFNGQITLSGNYGSLVVHSDGHYDYTLDPAKAAVLIEGQRVNEVFNYTLSDGTHTSSANLTVTITGINNVAVVDVGNSVLLGTVTEDDPTVAVGHVTIIDADAGQSGVVAHTVADTYGEFKISSNGQWTYTLDSSLDVVQSLKAGEVLERHFTVVSLDGTASQVVTVMIHGVNDAPVAVADSGFTTAEDSSLNLSVGQLLNNDTDVDGDTLSISSVQGATHGTVNLVAGSVVFTPDANYNGPASFTYTINDGHGGSSTATVSLNVTPVNDPPVAVTDVGVTTPEDTVIKIPVTQLTGNDTDIDGDTLVITSVQNPTHGTVTLVGNEVVFTPDPNYNGPANFTYTISDGHGGSSTVTVPVTVTPVNDAPVAANDSFTTPEDTVISLIPSQLLGNDSDIEGDTLTITSVQNATHGAVNLVGGNVVFTPDANYNGPAEFTYTISDGHGGSSTATVAINVTPVNDAPVAVTDVGLTTPEDTVIKIPLTQLTGNDTDVDGDTLVVTSVQNPTHGTVAIVGNEVVFTPDPNFNGPADFTYTISDGHGGSSTVTVPVTVTPVNDAPVAGNDSFTTPEDTAISLIPSQLLGNDSDVDGDTLTITSVQDATHGVVNLVSGNVVFTPDANYNGPAEFTYTISDGHGGTSTATVTLNVTPVNDPPVAVADSFTTPEDTAISLLPSQLLANDTDVDGDTLSISSVQSATHGTVALVAGNVVFTPDANYNGPASFTYTVSDGHGGSSTATVALNVTPVNDAPVATGDVGFVTPEDTAISMLPSQVLVNDTDIDGNPLTITSVQDATHGSVALVGGNVVFTPDPDYNGPASYTYTISDGQGGSSTATVAITVTPVNDAPVAVNDAGFSTTEDTPISLLPSQLLVNDTDVDGDTLSISSVQGASHGSVALVGGNVVFTPDANYNGPASFTYTISDGHGGTSTATVSLTVNPANDPPVAVADSFTTPEDTAISLVPAQLLANDTDLDGDTLSITSVQAASHGTVALVSGNVVFTPDANYNGPASFTYTISDGHGGSSTATVSLNVTPVNDPPVAVADSFTTPEDTAISLLPSQLLANDTDVDGDTLSISSVQGASHGTVALVAGNVVFTPDANYNGPASFTYTISDGHGGSSTATVSLNVTPVNDPPVAVADSFTTPEDTAISLLPSQLLANDTDVDGDTLSISSVQGASHGTVALVAGNVVFTPDANYNGPASFTYTISDGHGGSSTATVSLNVTPVNDPPVAVADSFTTPEDTAISLLPSQLLANDTDVDGDTLSISSVQGASHGTVALVAGNVVFTPDANYNGPASFTYTISDGHGGSSTATVSLNVTPVNDPPVAVADSFSTPEDTAISLLPSQLLANDTDVDGDTLSISSVQGASHGTVALVAGNVVFTPDANYNGPASFTYTISDGHGGSSTATVSLNVTPVNDPPVAVADSFTTPEDTAISLLPSQLLANDTDVDGDTLSISSVQAASHGTVALVAGNVVFTPDANYNGPASFTYTISDGHGGSSTATVSLNVTPVNDPPVAVADSFSTPEDSVLNLLPAQLLGNDTDVDGDTLSITSVQAASHGTVGLVAGNVVFTPDANYNGPASFTYTISDGHGGSSTATVSVNVTPVNDPPVAVADSFTTPEDTAISLLPSQLLVNDTDIDGDTLSISSVQGATNGTVALVAGNVVFTPDANYNGPASFTYTISDGHGGSSTATVSLNVTPVNDPPVAVVDSFTTAEDTAINLLPSQLLVNDTDADGDTLSITSVQGASNGTVSLVAGNVVFTPTANYNGPASFTYTITDGHGGNSTATVNLNVTPVNDPPVANPDSFTTPGNTPLTLAPSQLLVNDTDVDGDTLSIISVQDATQGSVYLSGGNVVFDPTNSPSGTSSFTYTISDGHGGTSTAAVTVNVSAMPVVTLSTTQSTITGYNPGLSGEYFGYRDNRTGSSSDPIFSTTSANVRLHADDGSADAGAADNIDRLADVQNLINGRNGNASLVYSGAASSNAATDATFSINKLEFGLNPGSTTSTISNNLGFNTKVTAGNTVGSGNNLYTFLNVASGNADSVVATTGVGDTTDAMVRMVGYMYLPASGVYDFRITADDGFSVLIGGHVVAQVDQNQNTTSTIFTGVAIGEGMQSVEILYWDQGINADFRLEAKLNSAPASDFKIISNDDYALFSTSNVPTLTSTQDIVETSTNGVWAIRTGATYNGTSAAEVIVGTDGRDELHGGGGNDIISGGKGNDLIHGGPGDDVMTGGLGSDTFVWKLGDAGTVGQPAHDRITDFSNATIPNGGDVLDLRDLLQGESQTLGNLGNYLHFETVGSDTVLHVSSGGGYAGGFSATKDDVQITLTGVDLANLNTVSDATIIQQLLTQGKLISD